MAAPAEQRQGGGGPLLDRLRAAHLEMVEAVMCGEGLGRVATIAQRATGVPVALVVPRIGTAGMAPRGAFDAAALRKYADARVRGGPAPVPDGVGVEVPIASGDEVLGVVVAAGGDAGADVREFLQAAALASMTEIAVQEAREEVEENLRGSFLEELRSGREMEPREIARRAARLGCDLARGLVVLCAELATDRPRHVVATIAEDHPGALAQHLDGDGGAPRVYALLPAAGGDEAPEATLATARRLATRLQRYGVVGLSSFYADVGEVGRAIQEAELVLDVLRRSDGGAIAEDIGTGTYRLLFRVLASHPEEVRSFYEDTVAPLVRYDDQYATDLVGTVEAYLEHNCNMNATATAIYAHRHTVAYRLERVKELSGLDPTQSEDRERLGLGLKAYRIIAPRLPR